MILPQSSILTVILDQVNYSVVNLLSDPVCETSTMNGKEDKEWADTVLRDV
jgi:hypothetical protein